MFLLVGVERTDHGVLANVQLRQTELGETLSRLCQAPFNHNLADLWATHQGHITNVWMYHLITLFELVANFVNIRTSAGLDHAVQFMNLDIDPQGKSLVCTSLRMPSQFRHQDDNFLCQLCNLQQEFRWWAKRYYRGDESIWTQVTNDILYEKEAAQPDLVPSKDKREKLTDKDKMH